MIAKLKETLYDKGDKSKLIRGSFGNLVIKAGYTLLTFLTSVLLARYMGASGYGSYTKVYAIIMVLAIPAQFGMPMLIVRETAQALVKENWGLMRGLWQWSTRITAYLALIITAGTILTVFIIGDRFAQASMVPLLWGLALIPLLSLGALRGAALRGLHKIIPGQLPEQVLLPGFFVILVLFYHFLIKPELDAGNAMMLQAAAGALAFIIGAILLVKATPREVTTATSSSKPKEWLTSMFSLAIITGMQLINKWVSILILGLFVTDAQIGIYRVAIQMSTLADIGLQVLNPVVAPEIAHLFAQGKIKALQRLATWSARGITALNLVITIVFFIFGKWILKAFFGVAFTGAYTGMLILLIGQVINALTGVVGFLLNMTGYEKFSAGARIVSTTLNVVLNFVLSPILGIIGAAIASAFSLIVWNVMLWFLVKRKLGINSFIFGRSAEQFNKSGLPGI